MSKFFKGKIVRHVVTGQQGIVRGIWLNEFSGQYVVNVTIGNTWVSWNAVSVSGLV